MSEDLVKRLRTLATKMFQSGNWGNDLDTTKEAADRIEQLERELSISRMAQVVMDNSVAEVEALTEDNARLRRALHYYADFHEVPNDGPWGVHSDDFGAEARAALIEKPDLTK